MKIFVIMSHVLTEKQMQELQSRFSPQEIIPLPEHLKQIWSNIPPEGPWNDRWLADIFSWLEAQLAPGAMAIVQGEFGATFSLVNWLQRRGHSVYYSTTERKAVERKTEDGSIIVQRTFDHVCFRKYPNYKSY